MSWVAVAVAVGTEIWRRYGDDICEWAGDKINGGSDSSDSKNAPAPLEKMLAQLKGTAPGPYARVLEALKQDPPFVAYQAARSGYNVAKHELGFTCAVIGSGEPQLLWDKTAAAYDAASIERLRVEWAGTETGQHYHQIAPIVPIGSDRRIVVVSEVEGSQSQPSVVPPAAIAAGRGLSLFPPSGGGFRTAWNFDPAQQSAAMARSGSVKLGRVERTFVCPASVGAVELRQGTPDGPLVGAAAFNFTPERVAEFEHFETGDDGASASAGAGGGAVNVALVASLAWAALKMFGR